MPRRLSWHGERLNDTLGHDAGDRALGAFAALLRRVVGEGGLAARWGGEEFLLVLDAADAARAYDVAEGLRAGLPDALAAGVPAFTASFGVADCVMAAGFAAAVEIADAALYRAKEGGRNRVTIAARGQGKKAAAADSRTAEQVPAQGGR